MDLKNITDGFAALGQETRIGILQCLVRRGPDGLAVGELAEKLGVRQNTLSANLSVLQNAGLISSKRHGRSIQYAADMQGLAGLLNVLLQDICGGSAALSHSLIAEITRKCEGRPTMSDSTFNVLFLCTGNSARSLMAEAIMNSRSGQGGAGAGFKAYSAGSFPKGSPDPAAIALLEKLNHETGALRSKSWDEFAGPEAPQMHFVFTVCDNAAKEVCPVWPGQPMSAHWGVPDPAVATGNETERKLAYSEAYRMLSNRISIFQNLPFAALDRLALKRELDAIGKTGAEAGMD